MNAQKQTIESSGNSVKWIVIAGLALVAMTGSVGCDEMAMLSGLSALSGLNSMSGINYATQNVPSWNGLVNPGYTSALGLPENPSSYWNRFFAMGY